MTSSPSCSTFDIHPQHLDIYTDPAYTRECLHLNSRLFHSYALQSGKDGGLLAMSNVRHTCVSYHIYGCIRESKPSQSYTRTYSFQVLTRPTWSSGVFYVLGGSPSSFHPSCMVRVVRCSLPHWKNTKLCRAFDIFPIGF